ncbi:hsp70-binding protein 1 [Erpetoichthys calabaricus]|uniref:hsp70-binding protein 1 n=1 Tax=Erpetoichthys calabaricus TaxID=27687 RepID=UPI0022343B38|nr:hsp70-binding protein 1 [Erpetoichthys calabaricus]
MAEGSNNGSNSHLPNLQGVLRLAVEASTSSDSPVVSEPMSEERKAWLQEALSDLCRGQLDEVQQMKECLEILNTSEERSSEEEERDDEQLRKKEGALELLADLCENLDNACDLVKLGGLEFIVSHLLNDPSSGIRWRSAHLIGCACQNMPAVQSHLLTLKALPNLLELVDKDLNDTVRIKALYAVSCLVREEETAFQEFLQLDGFSVLLRGMQSGLDKLRTKSAFLLHNLLISHPEHRDTLISMGMVQQLVSVLRMDHQSFHEYVLGALCSLVNDSPNGVRECQSPRLHLEELLHKKTEDLSGREECQEVLQYCDHLLKSCFHMQCEENAMDR